MRQWESAIRRLLLSQLLEVAAGRETKGLRGESHRLSMAKCNDRCKSCLRDKVRKVTRDLADKVPLCAGISLEKMGVMLVIGFEHATKLLHLKFI